MKPYKNNGLRHGEVVLLPVDKMPEGKTKRVKSYTLAHSETGHHHVIESDVEFDVLILDDVFVHLHEAAEIVHKKTFDQHKTLPVKPGVYKRYEMVEYDIASAVVRRVQD